MINKFRLAWPLVVALSIIHPAMAQTDSSNSGGLEQLVNFIKNSLVSIGNNLILPAAGALVVIFIIWGGIQYIQGNSEAGKKTITAAVIGLMITILATVIFYTAVQFFH